MTETYTITTNEFSGPFETLLKMVEDKKLSISDIDLSTVAEGYVTHIRSLPSIPAIHVSSSLFIISTLLLIKARVLFPLFTYTQEEESDINELKKRLEAYAVIRTHSKKVMEQFIAPQSMFFTKRSRSRIVEFTIQDDYNEETLSDSLQELVRPMMGEKLQQVSIEKNIHIQDIMDSIIERISTNTNALSFKELAQSDTPAHIVVSFLALLELIKGGIIHTDQKTDTDTITIHKI